MQLTILDIYVSLYENILGLHIVLFCNLQCDFTKCALMLAAWENFKLKRVRENIVPVEMQYLSRFNEVCVRRLSNPESKAQAPYYLDIRGFYDSVTFYLITCMS
jgi:hypothetical protein